MRCDSDPTRSNSQCITTSDRRPVEDCGPLPRPPSGEERSDLRSPPDPCGLEIAPASCGRRSRSPVTVAGHGRLSHRPVTGPGSQTVAGRLSRRHGTGGSFWLPTGVPDRLVSRPAAQGRWDVRLGRHAPLERVSGGGGCRTVAHEICPVPGQVQVWHRSCVLPTLAASAVGPW